MYLTLTAKTAKALSKEMRKIITRKTKPPILRQVLVEGNEERQAFITGDNLEERLTFRVPAKEVRDTSGSAFLVPFDDFKNITKGMKKNDTLHVISESEQVTLSHESEGVCVPHFPPMMSFEQFPTNWVETNVEQSDLNPVLEAFKELATFVSTDSKRVSMQGVFCDSYKKRMVSTDGHRMALVDFDDEDFPFDQDIIIPVTQILVKTILSGKGGISVVKADEEKSEQQILVVHTGPWQYQVRCIDHAYPAYKQVIHDSNPQKPCIDLKKDNLPMMCDILKHYASEKVEKSVVLYADTEGVSLVLLQDYDEEPFSPTPIPGVEIKNVSTNVSAWLSASYLLDAFNTGYYKLEILDEMLPIRFTKLANRLLIIIPNMADRNDELVRFMGQRNTQ